MRIAVRFLPKNPVTEPDFDKVVKYESVFVNFDDVCSKEAANNVETIEINKDYKTEKIKVLMHSLMNYFNMKVLK